MTTDTAHESPPEPMIIAQVQLITRCGCTRICTVTGEVPEVIHVRLHDYDGNGQPGEPTTSADDCGMYRSFRYKETPVPMKWPVYVEEA